MMSTKADSTASRKSAGASIASAAMSGVWITPLALFAVGIPTLLAHP